MKRQMAIHIEYSRKHPRKEKKMLPVAKSYTLTLSSRVKSMTPHLQVETEKLVQWLM